MKTRRILMLLLAVLGTATGCESPLAPAPLDETLLRAAPMGPPFTRLEFDALGYHVVEFPIRAGFPYVAEFDFFENGEGVFAMAGFRKEGPAGVHRDLEVGFRPDESVTHYVVDRYTGAVGSNEFGLAAPVSPGWHHVRIEITASGHRAWLDDRLVSETPLSFHPDKLWVRVANGPVPGVAGTGAIGTVNYRVWNRGSVQ